MAKKYKTKAAEIIAKRKSAAPKPAPEASLPPLGTDVYYSVTLFVHRERGNKSDMIKHYQSNGDPLTIYPSAKAWREAKEAALQSCYGNRKEKGK